MQEFIQYFTQVLTQWCTNLHHRQETAMIDKRITGQVLGQH